MGKLLRLKNQEISRSISVGGGSVSMISDLSNGARSAESKLVPSIVDDGT